MPKEQKFSINDFFTALQEQVQFRFFSDDYKDVYAQYAEEGHYEIRSIRSEQFIYMIMEKYYHICGAPIAKDTLKGYLDALPFFCGQKINAIPSIPLSVRVASKGIDIYYDLTNTGWDMVKISREGFKVLKQEQPIFRRNNGQNAQDLPEDANCFENIFDYLNIGTADQLLLAVSLISYFIPDIDHPIIMFSGKPGVSKSTSHAIIKSLVDPTIVASQKLPKEDKELLIQWRTQYVLFYDNISTMSSDMSDAFCRGVTGEGSSSRKLYTDNDEIYYNLRRCFLVNGIDQPGTKPDLMQRSVLIELEPISEEKRKTKEEIFESFNAIKPRLLGSIFNIISRAMTIKDTIKLDKLPRMADFAIWGEAISRSLGYRPNTFLDDFCQRQESQEKTTAEFDPLYNTIVSLLEESEEAGLKQIDGSATEILTRIKEKASYKQRRYLPQSIGSFGKKLNRMKDIYKQNNLIVTTRVLKGRTYYNISLVDYAKDF